MSFLRSATASARFLTRRAYSTGASAEKSSNSPYYFLGAGVVGLGAYFYLNQTQATMSTQEKSPLDPNNFVDFKLKKIIPYNHNTSTFVFELPNNEASLLPVASCLVIKSSDPTALVDANGKSIIRPYTPISQPDEKGVLSLLVKKYENGNASKHIHSLKEGDTLAVKGPIPKWPYKHNEFDEVTLIGGGSGITPLYQVISHALPDPANRTKFTLVYSNVTEADILLRPELDTLQKSYPNNLQVVYALDKPPAGWTGPTGFISKDLLKKYVAPASLNEKVKVFVCGPPGQVAALAGKKDGFKQGELSGALKELGYTEDQVFKF
ncbi:cytochrome-b5 reductase [Guyanagaster necrorhizus]|uniref:NADH-cytochrome b5 reductase n=1 Tax=Guyanagaster necrorhizus TaxID=856835 RepID=A0A9P8AXS5_9AGAR|nr:cytochrome-b5 reductase [Guyanagaster necrorhizus MCA 3950]KAG7452089.1 cytochrome-b5 reductase [Guyanagaster necrorhizus MCA 3950]